MRYVAAMLMVLAWCAAARAQETGDMDFSLEDLTSTQPAVAHTEAAEADSSPHPILPSDALWSGSLLIVIGAMFGAAAIVGPTVHEEMPEAFAPSHTHEEGDADAHGDSHSHDAHGHGH